MTTKPVKLAPPQQRAPKNRSKAPEGGFLKLEKKHLSSKEVYDGRRVEIIPNDPRKPRIPAGFQFCCAGYRNSTPVLVLDQNQQLGINSYKAVSPNPDYRYKAYRITTPFQDVKVFLDPWLNVPDVRDHPDIFNFRLEHLESTFGLVNPEDSGSGGETMACKHHGPKWVIQDSCGFQLFSKKTDWINPVALLSVHQDVDLGVSLDYPFGGITGALSRKDMEHIAKITKLTNTFFDNHGYESYLSVNHGFSLEDRWTYADVAGSGGAGLCIAGFRTGLDSDMRIFAGVIVDFVKNTKYKHFHILGVSTIPQFAIMAKIGHLYGVLITSDSASWVAQSQSGMFTRANLLNTKLDMSKRASYEATNCDCWACNLVGNSTFGYASNCTFLGYHNMIMYDRAGQKMHKFFEANPRGSVERLVNALVQGADMRHVDDIIEGKRHINPKESYKREVVPKSGKLFGNTASKMDGEVSHRLEVTNQYIDFYKAYVKRFPTN